MVFPLVAVFCHVGKTMVVYDTVLPTLFGIYRLHAGPTPSARHKERASCCEFHSLGTNDLWRVDHPTLGLS